MSKLIETTFWQIIDDAWAKFETANEMRLEPTKYPSDILQNLNPILNYCVLPEIEKTLESLDQEALIAFDHILTQKLYDIDRAGVHHFIG